MIVPYVTVDATIEEVRNFYLQHLWPSTEISTHAYDVVDTSVHFTFVELLDQRVCFMNGSLDPHDSAISFMLVYNSKDIDAVRTMYERMREGGSVDVPLNGNYARFRDKYGVAFELWLDDHCDSPSFITRICFTETDKKLTHAAEFYADVFVASTKGEPYYTEDGSVETLNLTLDNLEVSLFEEKKTVARNRNITFALQLDNQADINYYYAALCDEELEGNWVRDAFGLTWIIEWDQFLDVFDAANDEGKNALIEEVMGKQPVNIERIKQTLEE